ncbi:hypothetical protein UlMin_003114 [Ulmus minor]
MASTSTVESSRTENSADIEKNLFNNVMKREWEEVFNIYRKYPQAHKIKITSSGKTALHVAISDHESELEEKYKVVSELLQIIKGDSDPLDVLKLKNVKGQTPLHLAAAIDQDGRMCKICVDSVVAEKASELVRVRDRKGETPLFVAVHHGRLGTLLYLHSILGDTGRDFSFCVKDDGQSILHEAIIRENFELAFHIIHLYKDLVNQYDKQGESPLHALARKAAAFPSGSTLRSGSKIIYNFSLSKTQPKSDVKKKKYTTGRKIYPEKEKHVWANQVLNELLKHATMYDNKGSVHRPGQQQKVKEKHLLQDLVKPGHRQQSGISDEGSDEDSIVDSDEEFEDNTSSSIRMKLSSSSVAGKDESSKIKKMDTALLLATKYGIFEMVTRIIEKFPVAIDDLDQESKNILLVAVEKRHLKIYKLLLEKYPLKSVIFHKVDKHGNTALHFAARYGESVRSWPVPGEALQMQWEIKWLEFVEKTMPQHLLLRTNTEGQTPKEIFSIDHKPLVKAGGAWLIGTATSCSVVAALIVTIAYASSTTVPGGTESDSGNPKLRQIPTFELFAIASLAALCFSVTSLITFLAILTSRHEEKDFDKNLPRKILLGLTSLFVSIAAMLVTFSAGHFIVFKDKFKYAAFPVYAVTFLPLCLFAAAQFPLYIDIFRASFWNPF